MGNASEQISPLDFWITAREQQFFRAIVMNEEIDTRLVGVGQSRIVSNGMIRFFCLDLSTLKARGRAFGQSSLNGALFERDEASATFSSFDLPNPPAQTLQLFI